MDSLPSLFIEITTTDDCNCNCKYCFEHNNNYCKKDRNLKIEERQIELLKATCQQFKRDKYQWLTISFWGGEPLLNIDFMLDIINVTCQYDFVRYHIYSNGTLVEHFKKLISQSFIEQIKNRLHVQLSYDGEPHHSFMRGDNSKRIFETADVLKEVGVQFSFKATLSFDMLDKIHEIWKSYEKLYEKYGVAARYSPTLDTTYKSDDKLDVWISSLLKILPLESKFIKKHGHTLWDWFSLKPKKANCMLGNSIHVHNNGKIYICHGCAYIDNNKNLQLGDINNIQSFLDVLSDKYQLNAIPYECQRCCATYCQVCHANEIDVNKDPYEQWISCRTNNFSRCKYYKIFGFLSKILKLSVYLAKK